MRRTVRITSAFAALLVAACGRQSTMDEQMKKDLEAASVATMELAPRGSGTRVVSAVEQINPAEPQVTKTRQVTAPSKTPPPTTPRTNASTEPAATRPTSTPKVSPPPPGGYKTVGEVLRKAPFPIKP